MESALPELAHTELERVVRRWQQLPLDRALAALPAVRDLTQDLADAVRRSRGQDPVEVPDLGPAVAIDQLRALTYDVAHAGLAAHLDLAARLAALRRALP